jgi:hypothetical protein
MSPVAATPHHRSPREPGASVTVDVSRSPLPQYVYDFGCPAAPPFNGQSLQYCTGSEFNWPYVSSTMGLACNFTGGSSGGPWLRSFGGEWGYINGVNDFGYSSLPK